MWSKESKKNIMLVGHRGVRALYPENTIISFKAALELKMDLIEFDVHFTKEKQIVVCHDATIDRTTDGTGAICDMTLAEVKSYDAGSWKSEEFAGQRIPTLEEVLTLMANADYEVLLNVEIKDSDHELVDRTIEMLKKFNMDQRSVIACFDAEIINYTQNAHPEMKTQGFPPRYMFWGGDAEHSIPESLYDKMYGMGIPIAVDEESLAKDVAMAKQYDIKPWLFCADNEEDTIKAVKAGATNITCNDPYPTIKYLQEHGLHEPMI